MTKKPPEQTQGRFAYEGLDRVLHEKARLGIMTSLVARPDGVRFSELKELCLLTDGNLNRHLDVLHKDGLIEIWKGYEGKRPQTLCRITVEGRKRFVSYLAELEKLVHDANPVKKATTVTAPPKGWIAGWT